MGKLKIPSKPPQIDMTPMVDLFFLLLVFFILTTSFRPEEAVEVDTPTSISDKLMPEKNIFTVYISKDSRVFFNVDNGVDTSIHVRRRLLEGMIKQYPNTRFSAEQILKFEKSSSFGMPIEDLPKWLDAKNPEEREALQTGIPYDSINNQLRMWFLVTRQVNPDAEVAIKGDSEADYKNVKKVFDMIQDVKINRFNLTTNLEKVETKLEN